MQRPPTDSHLALAPRVYGTSSHPFAYSAPAELGARAATTGASSTYRDIRRGAAPYSERHPVQLSSFFKALSERPKGIVSRMVDAGLLGRKAGRGFFSYSPKTTDVMN